MANIKSAEKRNRQRSKRRLRNRDAAGRMRTAVKRAQRAIRERSEQAPELVRAAERDVHRAVTKGAIHRNKGSRLISRLSRRAAA